MSDTQNIDLKPCPFCGGKARMSAWVKVGEYSAYCTKCGATAGDYRATEAEAVEAWNRRELAAGGDAAKLREVLEWCRDFMRNIYDGKEGVKFSLDDIERIDAALAAPPRNCDKYTTEKQVEDACEGVRGCSGCFREDLSSPCVSCTVSWLLAPATEKKGGAE